MTSAECTPSPSASAQAASTATSPSLSTALRMSTIPGCLCDPDRVGWLGDHRGGPPCRLWAELAAHPLERRRQDPSKARRPTISPYVLTAQSVLPVPHRSRHAEQDPIRRAVAVGEGLDVDDYLFARVLYRLRADGLTHVDKMPETSCTGSELRDLVRHRRHASDPTLSGLPKAAPKPWRDPYQLMKMPTSPGMPPGKLRICALIL
jgi:hypothetical protein